MFNAISSPATRSAPSEAKRCRIGVRRQRPELERSSSDFRFGRSRVRVTVPVGHMAAPTSVAEAPKKPSPTESRPHRVASGPPGHRPNWILASDSDH
jgi:hypothetical protein